MSVPLGVFAVAAAPAAQAQDLPVLIAQLHQLAQSTGPGQSLADKDQQFESYVNANDVADACATLGALINEVQAQTGKTIPAATAAELLGIVGEIQSLLGC